MVGGVLRRVHGHAQHGVSVLAQLFFDVQIRHGYDEVH